VKELRILSFCSTLQDYNVSAYIIRRARDEFRSSLALPASASAVKLKEVRGTKTDAMSNAAMCHENLFVMQGQDTLLLIQRQSIIAGFYRTELSVMETKS
jgi:hypothetical protein